MNRTRELPVIIKKFRDKDQPLRQGGEHPKQHDNIG